ncbi:hypothetical protein GCM10009765_38300 [Fodinicola feengrottensis]|uniref:non-specific serine/threonine protein kinase n=1 Tax=Fodinicola feengrottensis TaxID=435914 RepID=A0ABN2HCK9_9ACTN
MQAEAVLGGRYRLVRRLGRGGMGEVWEARDQELSRQVAIKILLSAFDDDRELTNRLRQEARTAAALQHPGITVVHDIGEHDGHPYFVMELLTGHTFAKAGVMPVDMALELMAKVADALAYAHDRGVVHRDIKPENLISVAGGVKICDFGIAHYAEASARLTKTGTTVGTAPFMAPEQWRGESVDARTDLYAFGATLHVLLTGEPPFPGPTYLAYAHQHLADPAPRLSGVADELADLVHQLLAKDPADRPANAREVAAALRAARAESVAGNTTSRIGPAPVTLTNTTFDMLKTNVSLHAQIWAWFLAVPLAIIMTLRPDVQIYAGAAWYVKPLVTGACGAAAGAVLGVFFGLLATRGVKSDTITLDAKKLTVVYKAPTVRGGKTLLAAHYLANNQAGRTHGTGETFTIGWDALERIDVDGDGSAAALSVRFRASRQPSPEWVSKHGATRREDGGYRIYGPASLTTPEKVKVGQLRDLLPRYAGHLYDKPGHAPHP